MIGGINGLLQTQFSFSSLYYIQRCLLCLNKSFTCSDERSYVVGVSWPYIVIRAEGLPTEVRRYLNMTPLFGRGSHHFIFCCLCLLTVCVLLIKVEDKDYNWCNLITMAVTEKSPPLTRASVESALELIKPYIHRTPVLTSTTLSNLASTPQTPEALIGTAFEGHTPARPRMRLFFKCENFQRIGAFKSRGAFHALARLSDEELSKGVVTHSSGTPPISQSPVPLL